MQLGFAARASAPLRAAGELGQETDAGVWMVALRDILARLAPLAGGDPVTHLAVSGNGPTVVAAGADGEPLAPALLWMDRRAESEARELEAAGAGAADATFCLPKALWLARNRPEITARARWFLSCPEYVSFCLCGRAATFIPDPYYERYIWVRPASPWPGLIRHCFRPRSRPAKSSVP